MGLSDSLETLRKAGFSVPAPVEQYVKQQELKQRGIAQVWECNCGWVYESPTPLTFLDHGCGKVCKLKLSA